MIYHLPFTGELTNDWILSNNETKFTFMVDVIRFKHGIQYSCTKPLSLENFGRMECIIGNLAMESNKIEENFIHLLKDVMNHKPKRDGDFIKWIWCTSPPSNEKFSIDVTKYVKDDNLKSKSTESNRNFKDSNKDDEDGDDEDDDDDDDEKAGEKITVAEKV